MSIAKIISGGQNGADLGGLRAAKARGIPTGGTMPKGWKTLDGSRPEYAAEYGLVEHASPAYPPRTFANVAEADITIRIALNFDSPGERLTLMVCEKLGRPRADIPLRARVPAGLGLIVQEQDVFDAIEMIWETERKLGRNAIVNIAGNAETHARGMGDMARSIVMMLIDGSCGGP